eukprot:COSAG02_NODE_4803_length_4959_cov_3.932716_5_plen_70_part_00
MSATASRNSIRVNAWLTWKSAGVDRNTSATSVSRGIEKIGEVTTMGVVGWPSRMVAMKPIAEGMNVRLL